MPQVLRSLQERLAPAEEIFFTWLVRVMVAAVLVGSAWIDDAPPLEIAAAIVAFYVVVRVVTQFGNLVSVAPFENQVLKVIFAIGAVALLGLSFFVIAIFVERLAGRWSADERSHRRFGGVESVVRVDHAVGPPKPVA